MAGTDASGGQALWQPGGAEEDSRLCEGNRHLHLAYDEEEEEDCTVNCLQHAQVAWAQSSANHVQHTKCLSRVTCSVPRGTKGQLSYQVWQSLKSMYSSFILLAETITPMKEGRKWEYPKKTPGEELQKMPHSKARNFKPQQRLEPALYNCGRLGNQTC